MRMQKEILLEEHPPQVNSYEITHSTRMRFTATAAATNTNVTFASLLDTIVFAATTTAGYDVFDLVKIRRVQVWGQAALGTPSTVQVVYITATGDRAIHTDTSLGVKPAYVSARPNGKSLSSFWQITSAGNAFNITCPAGSIIDVSLSFRTGQANPTAAQSALVAATAGELYYRGLDGQAAAATNFPPPTGLQAQ